MKSPVRVDSPDKKNVRLELDDNGRKLAITMPPKDAGLIAAGILAICRQIPATDNRNRAGEEADWAVLRANQVALGSSPDPDCESMVFGFGDAQLAVSIKSSMLKQLGEALILLSAGGRPT